MKNNRASSFFDRLFALLFVPRCALCRERLLPEDGALCPICRAGWESAKCMLCRHCGKAVSRCLCKTNPMLMYELQALIKLGFYEPAKKDRVVNRVIYQLKRADNKRLNRFLAEQLAQSMRQTYGEPAGWLVTYAPRRPEGIRKYGHDQARQLARELARELGLECKTLFRASRAAKEQKTLDISERLKNAEVSFSITDGADVAGKTVIVVDDVTTSGATLGRCAQLLNLLGADGVVGAVIAVRK